MIDISKKHPPLFIFEMANNHMGDIDHGIKIIDEIKQITNHYRNFQFAFKLQYRDDSFFHPKHIDRKDHKLIKRFTETRLGDEKFTRLANYIKKSGFIGICTPWDEIAVDYIIEKGFDIIKIASCSFNDWPLLEKIATKPNKVIASTAGATKLDIDKVYSFFKHKKKKISLMHCVGEYPTADSELELNQIDYLIKSYPKLNIGWSTHEDPNNFESIKIAIAKGASIFEKHVGVTDKKKNISLNPYSANPNQIDKWLSSASQAFEICGGSKNIRKNFSDKEISDLRILHRGAYAKNKILKGNLISDNFFLAMPNIEDQLVAKDMGKFSNYKAKKDIDPSEPLMRDDFELEYDIGNIEDKKFIIKDKIIEMINRENIILPKSAIAEISHHYGIENFFEKGAVLFHIINKEYCKIVIMMFPNQEYPSHYHEIKNETYFILSGDLTVNYDNEIKNLLPGDTITIDKNKIHSFKTNNGVVFEEIGTSYIKGDSKYLDKSIINRKRKTYINLYD